MKFICKKDEIFLKEVLFLWRKETKRIVGKAFEL